MWKLGVLWYKFRVEIMMVWAMLRSPAAPFAAKLTAILAAIYIISPVDLIPDVIPIIGWLDDGIIAYVLIKLAFKFLPKDLYDSLRAQFEKRGVKVQDVSVKDITPKS
jgi:uncharacterized membrane protein YkvA (DUF1232 family)